MALYAPVTMSSLFPHLPIQTNLNPNNKSVQQAKTPNFPAYYIAPFECNEIYLRSGKIVDSTSSPIVVEQPEEENMIAGMKQSRPESLAASPQPTTIPDIRVTTAAKDTYFPLYPERLSLVKADPQREFDLLGELNNLFVKIPLLQAMKDVPIFAKTVRDLCLK